MNTSTAFHLDIQTLLQAQVQGRSFHLDTELIFVLFGLQGWDQGSA